MTQTIEEKIQKIEEATAMFKKSLEEIYLNQSKEVEFHGIGISNIQQHIAGRFQTNGKTVRIPLAFQASQVLQNPKSLPLRTAQWKVEPVVILMFHVAPETVVRN